MGYMLCNCILSNSVWEKLRYNRKVFLCEKHMCVLYLYGWCNRVMQKYYITIIIGFLFNKTSLTNHPHSFNDWSGLHIYFGLIMWLKRSTDRVWFNCRVNDISKVCYKPILLMRISGIVISNIRFIWQIRARGNEYYLHLWVMLVCSLRLVNVCVCAMLFGVRFF